MHVHVADIGLTVSCIMSIGFGEEVSDCALLQQARADNKVIQLSDDVKLAAVAHNVALHPVTQYSQRINGVCH